MTSGLEGVVKVPYPDPDLDGEEACRKYSPPTKSIRESFAREIELLGAIDHPNVLHPDPQPCTLHPGPQPCTLTLNPAP